MAIVNKFVAIFLRVIQLPCLHTVEILITNNRVKGLKLYLQRMTPQIVLTHISFLVKLWEEIAQLQSIMHIMPKYVKCWF